MATIRDEVLQAALRAAEQPRGMFTMSVPTGGGTGASVVLCTATQPAWNRRDGFDEGFANVHEIAPPEMRLFDKLLRVTVAWPDDDQAAWGWPQVAERMLQGPQALCIVNTKGAAREVHAELKRRGAADALHLSTNMCPRHRLETIDEVRRRLRSGEPCRLVSTQLIEAGVDVDFPVVLREMAPLEAITQAAGRANREGLLNHADGTPGGRVVVFRAAERVKLDRWYEAGIGVVEADFLRAGIQPDIARPEHVAEYFRRLCRSGDLDAKKIQAWRGALSFEEVAKSYRLIEDATFPVVVATWEKARDDVEGILRRLDADWDRRLTRRLAPYTVNVRYSQMEQFGSLIADGPAGMKIWYGPYDEQIGMSSEFQSDWFTRPELKVERLSYPIMTPSAARGVLDAILWKPQMLWHVRSITALAPWWRPDAAARGPYEMVGVRRNEIQDKIAPRTVSGWIDKPETYEPYLTDSAGRESVQGANRTQRNTLVLRDVAYLIEATPLLTAKANRPRTKPPDIDEPTGADSVAKYVAMFQRRVAKGQCFHRPYLGCREFTCHFAPVDGSERIIDDWNESLGLMLYDLEFGGDGNAPGFFHAEVCRGVLHCDTLAPGSSGKPPIKVQGWRQQPRSEVPV